MYGRKRSSDRPRQCLAWVGCCWRLKWGRWSRAGSSDALGLWCKQDEYLACLCLQLVPNCEKIGYKLKNEDQVPSLGAIPTSFSGNFILKCLQYTQTHMPIGAVQLCPIHQAPPQYIRILCRSTKLSCHFPTTARLVEVCITQLLLLSPAKPVPINSLLMYFCHIFKKVVRVFIERPYWGGEREPLLELHCCYPLSWENKNILFSLLGGQG